MELDALRSLVKQHPTAFAGSSCESGDSLAAAERSLGVSLPETLKWLLREHGYSAACGLSNLKEAVADTLRCRVSLGLRHRYLLLNDWGDAGVVLLDSSDGRVCWCGSHLMDQFCEAKPTGISDADWYSTYAAWVADRLEEHLDE